MPSEKTHPQTCDRANTAIEILNSLPYAAESLPGIGGVMKARPEDFVVEEQLPYTACGQGEHVYATFRRSGWNTADAARAIQKRLGLAPSDVGWGGRKDKTAVVVQTLSLRLGVHFSLAEVEQAFAELPFDLLAVDRHRNKIKTGHVAANRFTILVSQPGPEALPRALAVAEQLKETGVPNFYGPQRFGHGWHNIHRGFALISSQKKIRRNPFMVSVVQSALFNIWLKERMQAGYFRKLLNGDLVKKTATGGMFTVEDLAAETLRFNAGEIVYTGPIYGFKMRSAGDAAGKRESALLKRFDLSGEAFRSLRAPGSRRSAIVHLTDIHISAADNGLCFAFTLPSGAYATTVMREFMRTG